MVGPLLTKLAIDRYLVPSGRPTNALLNRFLSPDAWTGLIQIAVLYLLTIAGALVCDFGEQYLMQWVGQKAMFDLRRQLMDHLQKLDLAITTTTPSAGW